MNTCITSIDYDNKIVTTSTNAQYKFEYLINTAPLNHFLKLFNNPDFNKLEKSLSYNKVLVFNLGFNKKSKFTKEHWIYVPSKNCNYYRIGFYDNILDSDKLSMYIEIGYSKDENIDIDKQLNLTLHNLKVQGIIDDSFKLEEYVSIVMDPAYVHINTSTEQEISRLKQDLRINNIYTIGRYGAWTYCSMEDCMLEAKNLSKKLV